MTLLLNFDLILSAIYLNLMDAEALIIKVVINK